MFRSPCAFRSAQCATLIALAAAAGISRFETPADLETTPAPEPLAVETATPRTSRTPFYRAVVARFALPFLHATRVADEGAGDSPFFAPPNPMATSFPSPRATTGVGEEFTDPVIAWALRPHAQPYAVGPPHCGVEIKSRAESLTLGDRSSRLSRGFVIAVDFWRGRLCGTQARAEHGRVDFLLSFALRGGPEIFFRTAGNGSAALSRRRVPPSETFCL